MIAESAAGLRRWGPPAVWMAVIGLCSTDAFGAEETSRLIGPLLRWLFPAAPPDTIALLHGALRKLGHVTEYGVLAILWQRALAWGPSGRQPEAALRALLVSVGFAVLDETHQAFQAARTGSPVDVGWDALGAVLGLMVRRLGTGVPQNVTPRAARDPGR